MNSVAREQLIAAYTEKGDLLVRDAQLCEAMLLDRCAGCKKEIAVLVGAVKCGVPSEIGSRSASSPAAALRQVLISRMQDQQGFATDAAAWAVDTWREAITGSREKTTAVQTEQPLPKVTDGQKRSKMREHGMFLIVLAVIMVGGTSWQSGELSINWAYGLLFAIGVVLFIKGS